MLSPTFPVRAGGEIRSLTGIRGVAACLVVTYHFFRAFPELDSLGLAAAVLRHGFIAVDLFFVLSGFVLAMNYGDAFASGFRLRTYACFLFRRLGRIYPLYVAMTLLGALLAHWHMIAEPDPSVRNLAANLLLVQAWDLTRSVDSPGWSISTEFASYLLFPLLFGWVIRGGRIWAFIGASFACAALVYVATRTAGELHQIVDGMPDRSGPLDAALGDTPFPLLRCLAGFILGLLAYRLALLAPVRAIASSRHAGDLMVLLVLALMAMPSSDVLLVVSFVPLVITLSQERSVSAWLLGGRVVFWLGLVSYSIYLTHILIADLLREPIARSLVARHTPHAFRFAALVSLAAVLPISAVCFNGIEKPGRDLSRRILGRLQGTA